MAIATRRIKSFLLKSLSNGVFSLSILDILLDYGLAEYGRADYDRHSHGQCRENDNYDKHEHEFFPKPFYGFNKSFHVPSLAKV